MSGYYNRAGERITVSEWALSFSALNRQVALDSGEDGAPTVSTVWLGIDHSFGRGEPLIFETMVFGGPLDQEQERYSTEAAALEGHQRMVERVRAAVTR